MKKYFYIIVANLFLLFNLSGCLETSAPASANSVASPVTYFEGVTAVTNMGGDPITIKVEWTAVSLAAKYNIYLLTKNPVTNTITFTLIDTVNNPLAQSYIHRDSSIISEGNLYTYRVNAVDYSGVEEGNQIQKSTLAFKGITNVQILSRTSAKVQVNTAGSFSQIQVTATPIRASNYTTLTTQQTNDMRALTKSVILLSSTPEATITGLLPGTTYSFKASAVVDSTGAVDGNNVVILKQTPSDSFGKGATTETLSDYQYRNIRLMQAFGDAPNELNRSNFGTADTGTVPTDVNKVPADMTEVTNPHRRMVLIVPNVFSGDQNNSYRITRTAGVGLSGNDTPATFDNAVNRICQITASGTTQVFDDSTCVVCDHITVTGTTDPLNGDCDLKFTNGVPPTFLDKSAAPPKKKYFYNIAKVRTQNSLAWVEELPLQNADDFYFAAHIPDPYMVLVQRDSVNYEMCSLLPNKSSDPKNYNRCAYSGIGAKPRTTLGEDRPSLPEGYYDFGYNLLVDRHALSCRWTGSEIANTGIDPTLPTNSALFTVNRGCNQTTNPICLSFALDAAGTDLTSDNQSPIAIAPNATRLDGTGGNAEPLFPAAVTITPNVAYSQNPKVLLNLQSAGTNCYAAFFDPTTLTNGNNTLVSTSTSRPASWTSVAEIARLALNKTSNSTTNTLIAAMKSVVSAATTVDPGPLFAGFSNRKRPVLSGLSNGQAVALCNAQTSSYGVKRLLRRREYVAATPLPSFSGEPGYVSKSEKSRVESGVDGQTLYNYERHPDPTSLGGTNAYYGGGTIATLGTNPGGCSPSGNGKAAMQVNPNMYDPGDGQAQNTPDPQNTTVSRFSQFYCDNPSGCRKEVNNAAAFSPNSTVYSISRETWDGTNPVPANPSELIDFRSYFTNFHNIFNEYAQISKYQSRLNSASANFFIGSMATNKCKSRFGMQDPYNSSLSVLGSPNNNGSGFHAGNKTAYGFILSDTFRQTSTTSKTTTAPVFEPVANLQDQGVVYDYKIKNGTVYTNIAISSDVNSAYTLTSRNGNREITCTQTTPIIRSISYQTDNFFYLNDRTSTAGADRLCQSNSTLMNATSSRGLSDFAGFLPVLGLPLNINISSINSFQDYTPFSTFVYNKEFADQYNGFRAYNRFYSTDITGSEIVNMSTGSASRWSYELSESSTINNGGQAWCAVEAE